jgi:hypothetical protein
MAIDKGTVSHKELVPGEYERQATRVRAVRWAPGVNNQTVSDFVGTRSDEFNAFRIHIDPNDGTTYGRVWNRSHSDWNRVNPYDWIIRGVANEFYPCERRVFAETYTSALPAAELAAFDRLRRDQLTGVPAKLAAVLDDWMSRNHVDYIRTGHHHVGDLLETLRAEGLGVFPIADRTG